MPIKLYTCIKHKINFKGKTAKGMKQKKAKDAYQLVITNRKQDKLCCS